METAKVDIRKLQLLNDRINQTIEALNQVRLSVHAVQQSGGMVSNLPFAGLGYSQQAGVAGYPQQAGTMGYPQQAYSQQAGTMGYPQQAYPQQAGVVGYPQQAGTMGYPQQFGTPMGVPQQGLFGALGFGIPQTTISSLQGLMQGAFPGVSHSSPQSLTPFGLSATLGLQNPLLSQLWGAQINPFQLQSLQGGLGHTSGETMDPRWSAGYGIVDPLIGMRILQTFPFAQWGYSPFAFQF